MRKLAWPRGILQVACICHSGFDRYANMFVRVRMLERSMLSDLDLQSSSAV